jgi:nucleoside-diphosphate-sugar epimerase
MNEPQSRVLVTGGSGFIGTYCILQLVAAGHRVRTTLRSAAREAGVRTLLRGAGTDAGEALEVVVADLEHDAGWREAVEGCDFVLHVASPFPSGAPRHEDELIVPAREGTLRVLRACEKAGVKRVVVTSSFAAVGYGQPGRPTPFDERDWTNPEAGVSAYVKSKTLAERAAWDFMAGGGRGFELSVVNPVGVLGPVLGPDLSTSIDLVRRLIRGGLPGCPRLYFGVVDVRDVADLHVRAMTHPAASGERFLAVAGNFMSMVEIARVLKLRMGSHASRVPARELPDWAVRLASLWDPAARQITPDLGKVKNATNEKARRLLGWQPRSNEECVVATAESLVKLGLVE